MDNEFSSIIAALHTVMYSEQFELKMLYI